MKVLLTKEQVNNYNMRKLTKKIFKKFDEYNYHLELAQSYIDSSITKELSDMPISKSGKSDPTWSSTAKREKVLKYIDDFELKLKYLRANLTKEEKEVLKLSIIDREPNDVLCNKLVKQYKAVYWIKKSCYVKVALRFNLVNEREKAILKAVSVLD